MTDVHDREIMKIAAEAVRTDNPREWHYALFDYGACVLTRDNTCLLYPSDAPAEGLGCNFVVAQCIKTKI